MGIIVDPDLKDYVIVLAYHAKMVDPSNPFRFVNLQKPTIQEFYEVNSDNPKIEVKLYIDGKEKEHGKSL